MGTPNYMSPEQLRGDYVDARSDIFAAGLVMYELLTYQKAFGAGNVAELVLKIISTDVPSIHQYLPDGDPELERIVATATRRDAGRRYQTTDEIRRDLQSMIRRGAEDDSATVAVALAPDRDARGVEARMEMSKVSTDVR